MWSEYRKLSLGLSVLGLIGLLTALVLIYALRTVIQSKDLVIYGAAHDLIELEGAYNALARKVMASRAFLLSGDERFADRIGAERELALAALERLRQRQPSALRGVFEAEQGHQDALDDLLEARRTGASADEAAQLWERELEPRHARLDAALQGRIAQARAGLEDARRRAARAAGLAGKLSLGMLAVLFPVVAGAAFHAARTISRLASTERRLDERAREQEAVADFGRRALRTRDVEGLAREAALVLAQASRAPWAAVLEPEGASLRLLAALGFGEGGLSDVRFAMDAFPGRVYQSGGAMLIDELRSGTGAGLDLLRTIGARSGLAVPIASDRGPLGVLAAFSPRPAAFEARHVSLAASLGNLLAYAEVRVREEERVRRSEEQSRLVVEGARDYAICMLSPDGRVASWNPGAQRVNGYLPEEILGKPWSVLYEVGAAESAAEHLKKAELEGAFKGEDWRVRKDGSRFWADVVLTALRDADGGLRGFVAVTRDATERRLAEEQVRRLNAELERRVTERTLQLEAFTFTVSHDLRAPLRAMSGFSRALLEECGPSLGEAGRDYARRIEAAARRMDALILDLLEYSRLAGLEVAADTLDLERVVDDVLAALEGSLREARAEVVVERPLPRAKGHTVTLHQVIQNLVSNALKFVAPGAAPSVRIRAERRDAAVRLWVEDRGIGIAPEHQAKVFELFQRLHGGEYPGTGVGLAIVKRAMERMGGRVGLESELGRGSRFWIELPAA